MRRNLIKHSMVSITILLLLNISFVFSVQGDCADPHDYGVISTGTELSGQFFSDEEDYWISFETDCEFNYITISTCGSTLSLDTVLEAYPESEVDCEVLEDSPWNITNTEMEAPNWSNDNRYYCEFTGDECFEYGNNPSNGCGLGEDCLSYCDDLGEGSENHAELEIPTEEEQETGLLVGDGTYYLRISTYPGYSVGQWNLSISGNPIVVLPDGMDQTIDLPHNPDDGAPGGSENITFDASETVCTEQIESYNWLDSDGLVISGSSSTITSSQSLSYGDDGINEITLEASAYDGSNFYKDFYITFIEENTAPTADAGSTVIDTVAHDGSTISIDITTSLSASGSHDPEDDNLSYLWEQISGPAGALNNAEMMVASFTTSNQFGGEPATFNFQLSVSDPYGETDSDNVDLIVYPEQNALPVAVSPDLFINIAHDGDPATYDSESFILNADESFDPDGDVITAYEWTDADLNIISTTSIVYDNVIDPVTQDEYNYTLYVTDSYQQIGETVITVYIGAEPNEAPDVLFYPSETIIFEVNPDGTQGGNQPVNLDDHNISTDPEDDSIISQWFNEEGNSTSSYQLLSSDNYQSYFTLRVTDSYGAYSEKTLTILIVEPNSIPDVDVGDENDFAEYYESTADLDDEPGDDILYLNGYVYDDQGDDELGFKWELLTEHPSVHMEEENNLTGSFKTDAIPHNDYPLELEFSLTVWDPFSCHRLNTNAFYDCDSDFQICENDSGWDDCDECEGNGEWEEEEEYTDSNFNDEYDYAEEFTDCNEDPIDSWQYICEGDNDWDADTMGDGIWNEAEEFTDCNEDPIDSEQYICEGDNSWDAETMGDGEYTCYDYTMMNGEPFCTDGEPFTDVNNNNQWDASEEYTDSNGDNQWNPAEEYVDSNNNNQWDPSEVWVNPAYCSSGVDEATYGVAYLDAVVKNYNQAPILDNLFFAPNLIDIMEVNEDDAVDISFEYDELVLSAGFSDLDDCDLDILTGLCSGYSNDNFSIFIMDDCEDFSYEDNGEYNFYEEFTDLDGNGQWNSVCVDDAEEWIEDALTEEECLDNDEYEWIEEEYVDMTECELFYNYCRLDITEIFGELVAWGCVPRNNTSNHFTAENSIITLEENFNSEQSGESLTIPFKIDDNNETNNLSDLLQIDLYILPVNDPPEFVEDDNGNIIFTNEELLDGSGEEVPITLLTSDFIYYDVEQDIDGDGECEQTSTDEGEVLDECSGIFLCANQGHCIDEYNDWVDNIFIEQECLDNGYQWVEEYDVGGNLDIIYPHTNFFGDLDIFVRLYDGEMFVDTNGNCEYDTNESYTDANDNQEYDGVFGNRAKITIPIYNLNDPPAFRLDCEQCNENTNTYSENLIEDFGNQIYSLDDIFEDADGDLLTYTIIYEEDEIPLFSSSINGSDLEISSLGYENLYGGYQYTIEVSDNIDSSSQLFLFDFNIVSLNDAPLVNTVEIYCELDSMVKVIFNAIDVDSDEVGFTLNQLPNSGTLYLGDTLSQFEEEDCNNPYTWLDGACVEIDYENPIQDIIQDLTEDDCIESSYHWINNQCIDLNPGVYEDDFSNSIIYIPDTGPNCRDTLGYIAYDFDDFGEVNLSSNQGYRIVQVGVCNAPPIVSFVSETNLNMYEDDYIIFVYSDQIDIDQVGYYNLNNTENFIISDDQTDNESLSIELWEGDIIDNPDNNDPLFNYYIDSGYCAYLISDIEWGVDSTKTCGINEVIVEECSGVLIDTEFVDDNENVEYYCRCSQGSICITSQTYQDSSPSIIRSAKDYDDTLYIKAYANDGNVAYNLSEPEYFIVSVEGINDAPLISEITNQTINEGDPLVLNYIFSSDLENSNELTFNIYDVDIDNLEGLQFKDNFSNVFIQTIDNLEQELRINTHDENWNGQLPINITIFDEDGVEANTWFNLEVISVPDETQFNDLSVGDSDSSVIWLTEDTENDIFEIRIYYEDPDWDINLNPEAETDLDDIYLNWEIIPTTSVPSVYLQTLEGQNGLEQTSDGDYYYYSNVIVTGFQENFNGWYAAKVINEDIPPAPDTQGYFLLSMNVQQKNDSPDDFSISDTLISDYRHNLSYQEWPEEDASICSDEDYAQGTYTSNDICEISNFFIDMEYSCLGGEESAYYDTMEECESVCTTDSPDGTCESVDELYYRLPFSRVPTSDEIISDNLLFKWHPTSDVDNIYLDDNLELDIFYRIELIDQSNGRVIVLNNNEYDDENIEYCNQLECQIEINLQDLFFSYNSSLVDYYDSCKLFDKELTLSDTSSVYLDITGGTKYTWHVAANNNWCDHIGDDPTTVSTSTTDNSFYIDITPPKATISILQNNLAPEFMDLYITFDEAIDTFKSEIHIIHDESSSPHLFPSSSDGKIYHITELFPGTGEITIDVESWDFVSNGILASKTITYDEVSYSSSQRVESPTETLVLKFSENNIEVNSSIIIQEEEFHSSRNSLIDELPLNFHQVSQIYEISSVDMNIINGVDIEVLIPEGYREFDYWKFRIYTMDNGFPIDDITTWSKDERVFGVLNEIRSIALYFDPQAELEIPDHLGLLGNYPNPFNPTTNIYYFVNQENLEVRISILDLLGREVRVLYHGVKGIGYHELLWDGQSDNGNHLGSGIYFINAAVGKEHRYKKTMKLK